MRLEVKRLRLGTAPHPPQGGHPVCSHGNKPASRFHPYLGYMEPLTQIFVAADHRPGTQALMAGRQVLPPAPQGEATMPFPNLDATALLIRKLESIAHLSDEERQAIESLPVRVQALKSKQDIAREGDKPSQCCLVLDGWVCRYKLLTEGRRQILSFHVAGDLPDVQSLFVPALDYSLGTLTQSKVAFIAHEALQDLTARFSNLAAIIWRETLIDAAISREWLTGLGRRSAHERIAHCLCEMYERLRVVGLAGEHCCPLPLTQSELGDAMGLTPVHVNRVLKGMRDQGLITLRNSNLVIHAWSQLVRAGGFDPAYLHLTEQPNG